MFNPIGWVRAAFRNAARNGVQDFLQELASDDALPRQFADVLQPKLAALANVEPDAIATGDEVPAAMRKKK